jgi:hypothetical protein
MVAFQKSETHMNYHHDISIVDEQDTMEYKKTLAHMKRHPVPSKQQNSHMEAHNIIWLSEKRLERDNTKLKLSIYLGSSPATCASRSNSCNLSHTNQAIKSSTIVPIVYWRPPKSDFSNNTETEKRKMLLVHTS